MGNVLDFRTYRAPSQKEQAKPRASEILLIDKFDWNSIPLNERQAICYSRGVALFFMKWIRACCVVRSPDGNIVQDLPSCFLVQIANSLLNYKDRAEKAAYEGAPHCSFKLLHSQVQNMIKCDPHLKDMWRQRDTLPSNSLELADKSNYTVQWQAGWEMEWRSLERGTWFFFLLSCLL